MSIPKNVSLLNSLDWKCWLRSHALRVLCAGLLTTLGADRLISADSQPQSGNAEAVARAAAIEAGWHPETNYPALPPEAALRAIEVPTGYRLQIGRASCRERV